MNRTPTTPRRPQTLALALAVAAALAVGASLVNDISANRQDDAMWRVVAEAKVAEA